MSTWFSHFMAAQFRKPRGIVGRFVSNVMLERNQGPYARVLSELSIGPDHKVLEIGFGPGYGIRLVSKIVAEGEGCVCGIDYSKTMCNRVRRAQRLDPNPKKARLEWGDAADMPFNDGFFDFAFAVNVIYFWRDLNRYLTEIRRVLHPGGTAALYLTDIDSLKVLPLAQTGVFHLYTLQEVIEALESAGFSTVRSTSIDLSEGRERLGHVVWAQKPPPI